MEKKFLKLEAEKVLKSQMHELKGGKKDIAPGCTTCNKNNHCSSGT